MHHEQVRALLLGGILLVACGGDQTESRPATLEPVEIADQEGAVCGMLVRDQSAPRGQVIHRNGERAFLCSIGDLLAYLYAPSPHGQPLQVLVEVMDPSEDPNLVHSGPHPWIPAEVGVYVVGISRTQIMGPPVLVYRDRASAEKVVAGTSAQVLSYSELADWWQGHMEH